MRRSRWDALGQCSVAYDDEVRPRHPRGIIGCEHNFSRTLVYSFSGPMRDQVPTAMPGDSICLICPFGCQDLTIQV